MLDILLADRVCTENYRTKPEEPKFKIGDWVVNKTSKQRIIKKVRKNNLTLLM